MCVKSCQHLSIREEAHRGGGGEAAGAEACGRGHRRDEVTDGRVDKALLLPGSGHDSVAAEAAGLRLRAGAKTQALFALLCFMAALKLLIAHAALDCFLLHVLIYSFFFLITYCH